MIKYIGSKRLLVPAITAIARSVPGITTACDPFTGTTRVAQALKQLGLHVHANDTATYAATFARTYIAADASRLDLRALQQHIDQLNSLEGIDGYVTETWCMRSRFFQPHNGRRIDAIRSAIASLDVDDVTRSILVTSLIEAADRVDSTTGVQMAFLKQWSARSMRPLELRLPELLVGSGSSSQVDAVALGAPLEGVDLVYLDPPYNQHSYPANYHIWETIARGDEPEVYGRACKRVDIREHPSDFNSVRRADSAFGRLVEAIKAPWILTSFSDEGFLDRAFITEHLARGRAVATIEVPSRRYVGARIGIHGPSGRKVGRVSHTTNVEYLFLAGPDESQVRAALAAGAPAAAGVVS